MLKSILDSMFALKARDLRVILFLWVLSLLEIIISFLVIALKLRPKLGATVALHYNVLVGVDLFGKGYHLYQIPFVGACIFALNFFLYASVGRRGSFLAFLFSFITASSNLILLAGTLLLLRVN